MKRALWILSALVLLSNPLFAAKELRCSAVVADGPIVKKGTPPSFSATAVLDVTVLLQFKHDDSRELADGDHVAEVRFIGPQGFLYESRIVPLTADALKAQTKRAIAGYRRPVKKVLIVNSKSGNEVEARVPLPVAATSIVNYSMYGTWRAEAYLDGSATQCAQPALFAITR